MKRIVLQLRQLYMFEMKMYNTFNLYPSSNGIASKSKFSDKKRLEFTIDPSFA